MVEILNVASICPSTHALGPGKRFVVWVQGCPFNCAGCVSPDWIPIRPSKAVAVADLAKRIAETDDLEGVTISGGEPALQADGLTSLLDAVKALRPDLSVIAFSGFTLEQLTRRAAADAFVADFLKHLDVLIDGLYVKELDDGVGLRGSSNQRIHFLTGRYADMKEQFESGPRQVEVHLLRDELLMVGVPTRAALDALLTTAGELRRR